MFLIILYDWHQGICCSWKLLIDQVESVVLVENNGDKLFNCTMLFYRNIDVKWVNGEYMKANNEFLFNWSVRECVKPIYTNI